jgi:hypothetical protein
MIDSMRETAEFFRDLARRHRQLASELHNEEVIRDLLRLADDCEAKAEELTQRLRDEAAGRSST